MAWKDLLVFADGSDDGLTRATLALDLARVHNAHLEAAVVTILPQHPYGPTTGALEDAYAHVRRAAEARGAEAVAAIGRLAPLGAGFSAHQCEAEFPAIRKTVAAAARSADVVILGQPEAYDGSDLDTETLMGAVFGGGQPCLMVPRWVKPHAFGKRALIAWKATAQAARALHGALPLLQEAESVRLIVVDPRPDEPGETAPALNRLATHLIRHGVRVEESTVTRSSLDQVSRAIAGEIEEFGADLLVMGAYGHSRFGEFVFGGVSRDMIRDARIPILLAH